MLDSRVLCDQQLNECRKQRFASLSDVVHKLEETQIERKFFRHCQVVGDDSVTRQQQTLFGCNVRRPDAEAARSVPVISAQLAKRFRISWRYTDADNRCRRGRKC